MSEIPGGGVGFLSGLAGIASTIASAVGHFFQLTIERVLEFVRYLKDLVVTLSRELVVAAFRLGRALARAVRDLGLLAFHGARQLAVWAYGRLVALSTWLKDQFAPVLRWLHRLKDKVKEIYDRFVRPVVDAIEFIRQLNRILQVFHVDLLAGLDRTLAQIEDTLRKPFLWVEQKITWLENTIDRIITIDGLIQRLTLLLSLQRYAPRWINHFWRRQFDPTLLRGTPYDRERDYPTHEVLEDVNALTDYFADGGGDHAAVIGELSAMFVMALETVPHSEG